MKIIGLVVVLVGCIGFGVSIQNQLKLRVKMLLQMEEMFELLKSQIYYQKSTLPEACKEITIKVEEPFRQALLTLYEEIRHKRGSGFESLWKEVFQSYDKKINITKEEKEILYNFGTKVGHYDIVMQQKSIEQVIDEVRKKRKKAEISVAEQGKLALWLSTMGGLFLIIVFI